MNTRRKSTSRVLILASAFALGSCNFAIVTSSGPTPPPSVSQQNTPQIDSGGQGAQNSPASDSSEQPKAGGASPSGGSTSATPQSPSVSQNNSPKVNIDPSQIKKLLAWLVGDASSASKK